jgi:hypothetical protein
VHILNIHKLFHRTNYFFRDFYERPKIWEFFSPSPFVQLLFVILIRVMFNLRGGLAFQNKRTHQTVVGTLFSTVLDRAEQVGVRRKKSSDFF